MKRTGLVVVAGGFAFGVLAFAPAPARAQTPEVSRSSPIVAEVGGVESQYQGSFEVESPAPPVTTFNGLADEATFVFPYTAGHLRAVPSDDVPSTATALDDLAAVATFDAAALIPGADPDGCSPFFAGNCRTVFTTVDAPDASGLAQRPERVFFDINRAIELQPLLGATLTPPEVDILIGRVLEGALGGIDRSTLAVIEKSPFIPQIAGEDRPTMIYVGALDGMLHAICAEARGPCDVAGRELWAFIPRTQLGALRLNTQRIDGSVKVADVFAEFDLGASVFAPEFRTVLTFQTGSGDPAATDLQPSVIAIDVSNPADPTVLWERSTPASPSAIDLGVGLTLAMGQVRDGGQTRNYTFAQTNNGGSGGAGFYLAAIDTSTGEVARTFTHLYPAPRNGANPAVPDTGIPGGVAALDIDQSGFVTHVAVPSLYGDLWVAQGGDLAVGPDPVLRFSADFHPIGASPTVYADLETSRKYAVVVSGGYADPVAATWVQPTDNQFAVSVAVEPAVATLPIAETGSVDIGDRPFVITLDPGQRVTGQAVVAGNELFITSDSTDVNLVSYGTTLGTGTLTRFSLTTGSLKGTQVGIAGGGSSVDVSKTGVVAVGSGGGAMQVDVGTTGGGGAFEAVGGVIERTGEQNNKRLLWLNI